MENIELSKLLKSIVETQSTIVTNQKMMAALISAQKKKIKDLEARMDALDKKADNHSNDWK